MTRILPRTEEIKDQVISVNEGLHSVHGELLSFLPMLYGDRNELHHKDQHVEDYWELPENERLFDQYNTIRTINENIRTFVVEYMIGWELFTSSLAAITASLSLDDLNSANRVCVDSSIWRNTLLFTYFSFE